MFYHRKIGGDGDFCIEIIIIKSDMLTACDKLANDEKDDPKNHFWTLTDYHHHFGFAFSSSHDNGTDCVV